MFTPLLAPCTAVGSHGMSFCLAALLFLSLQHHPVRAGAVAVPNAAPEALLMPPAVARARAEIQLAPARSNKAPPQAMPANQISQQIACDPTGALVRELEETATAPLDSKPARPLRGTAPTSKSLSAPTSQAAASWLMGLLALHGICMPVNYAQAESWFLRANDLGEPLASAGMAWCAIEGCKLDANPASANVWLDRLSTTRPAKAQYLRWLQQSRLAPLPRSLATASGATSDASAGQDALLLSAARGGEVNAKLELGLIAVANYKLVAALAYFRDAARGSAAAKTNTELTAQRIKLAGVASGPLAGSNPPLIKEPNSRLSRPNSGQITGLVTAPTNGPTNGFTNGKSLSKDQLFALAQKYHKGEGVPTNYAQAITLYQQAKDKGSVAAQKMLALIFSRPTPDGQLDIAWMQQVAHIEVGNQPTEPGGDSLKPHLRREPTPLFDLIPSTWRRFAAQTIGA